MNNAILGYGLRDLTGIWTEQGFGQGVWHIDLQGDNVIQYLNSSLANTVNQAFWKVH